MQACCSMELTASPEDLLGSESKVRTSQPAMCKNLSELHSHTIKSTFIMLSVKFKSEFF